MHKGVVLRALESKCRGIASCSIKSTKNRPPVLYVHNRKAGLRPIACGVGGEICAVDTKDGKIVRIRPFDDLTSYAEEELEPAMRSVEVDGKDWLVNYNAPHRGFILSTKDGFEGVACGRAP